MSDVPNGRLGREDRALQALFAAAPEPADDGFSDRVIGRIGARVRRRRLVIALAVVLGVVIAAWPLAELVLQASDWFRALLGVLVEVIGMDRLNQYRPLLAGALLAMLTPVLVALLEE
jgi:hypothetical protein